MMFVIWDKQFTILNWIIFVITILILKYPVTLSLQVLPMIATSFYFVSVAIDTAGSR